MLKYYFSAHLKPRVHPVFGLESNGRKSSLLLSTVFPLMTRYKKLYTSYIVCQYISCFINVQMVCQKEEIKTIQSKD